MKNYKKKFIIIFIISFFNITNNIYAFENKIVMNVGKQIITSYELKNKIKTYLILNKVELNQDNINRAKDSALKFLINFKIKREEVTKYNQENDSSSVNKYLEDLAIKFNTNKDGLKKIFNNNDISYKLHLNEIETEYKWQKLIFQLYKDKTYVDEKEIEKELKKIIESQKETEEYKLSEIQISAKDSLDAQNQIVEVKKQIEQIGFNNTAIKNSSSLTATSGGDLGWINSQSLSKNIYEIVSKLTKGEVSKPIIQSNTIMFIKLVDKRKITLNKIDLDTTKKKIINRKRTEILTLYSNNHLSKLKNNTFIKYNEK
ncbi:peptidylprolyl isomerase [Pelagibacteraceae bacterium]|nr:peptidylprolyl isomerase [Pelagibacteraceae bacterium]